jgi:hypothetical protein
VTRRPFLAVLRRNWWVVVLGVLVTALGTVGAFVNTKPTFTADGSAFLVPAQAQHDDKGNLLNPYTTFGSSSANLGLVAVSIANGNAVSSKVLSEGGTATYTVSSASKAPIITVTATGHGSAAVARTVTAVIVELGNELQDLQQRAGVNLSKQIQVQPVKEPTKGKESVSKRLILPAVIAVLGLLASAALALAVDSLRGPVKEKKPSRRRPRGEAPEEAELPEVPESPAPAGRVISSQDWSAAASPVVERTAAPTTNGNGRHPAPTRASTGLLDSLRTSATERSGEQPPVAGPEASLAAEAGYLGDVRFDSVSSLSLLRAERPLETVPEEDTAFLEEMLQAEHVAEPDATTVSTSPRHSATKDVAAEAPGHAPAARPRAARAAAPRTGGTRRKPAKPAGDATPATPEK